MKAWIVLALVVGLGGCQGDEDIPFAMCPDDGSCFDEEDAERPPVDRGGRDMAAVDARVAADHGGGDALAAVDGGLDGRVAGDGGRVDGGRVDGGLIDGGRIDGALSDVGLAEAGLADAAPDAAPLGPVDDCAALDTTGCFGHPDCADGDRCQDVGPAGLPVPCCVPGRRGELPGGASCQDVDGQIECASGVCIELDDGALCSQPCERAADCPPALPRCIAFPFGETDFMWCFPP